MVALLFGSKATCFALKPLDKSNYLIYKYSSRWMHQLVAPAGLSRTLL